MRLATYLSEKQVPVAVVNSLVIKRFSPMRLRRTKTDQADAQLIAAYGELEKPALFITELQQESTVLEGLIQQRTALKNQQEAFNQLPQVSPQARRRLDTVRQTLQEQIEVREKAWGRRQKKTEGRHWKIAPVYPVLARKPLSSY